MDILSFMITIACILVTSFKVSMAVDSLRVSQSISDGNTLVSQGGTFELGFFSPGNSNKRYLGIWYKNIPIQTVVWVANRVNPINDSSGILTVNSTGNLVLTQNSTVVWYTSTTYQKQAHNLVAVLLDTSNLVVQNEGESNEEDPLWQSFDYPSDTSLPGMKLGRNLKLGLDWRLTSWKSQDDPSPGDFTWGLVLHNYPEFYMMKGTEKFFRIGPWNGQRFSGIPYQEANTIYDFKYVSNKDEMFYRYSLKNNNVFSRVVINQTSDTFNRYVWLEHDQNWKAYKSLPNAFCDTYGRCGANGNCIITQAQCQCLQRFSPKSPHAWNSSDWTQGCVRNIPLSCNDKHMDGFVKFVGVKVPDTTYTWLDEIIGIEECRNMCLDNCSCMAYTNSNITAAGSGCVMWFGDLIDITQFEAGGQDLFIRMPASELGNFARYNKNELIELNLHELQIVFIYVIQNGK